MAQDNLDLTNKYRPKRIEDLVGQETAKQVLSNVTSSNNRVYLFHSRVPGVGKTASARIIALLVNCSGENKPCLECKSCLSIINETTSDIEESNFADERGIDAVRDLKSRTTSLSMELKNKVYILDEFHQATNPAQNALLKLFEEPPQNTYFVLCTTDVNKIIPTIRSRCVIVEFVPIEPPIVEQRLLQICGQENIVVKEPEAIKFISENSNGSLRTAIKLLEQNAKSLTLLNVMKTISVPDALIVNNLIECLFTNSVPRMLSIFRKINAEKMNLSDVLVLASKRAVEMADETKMLFYMEIADSLATSCQNNVFGGAESTLYKFLKQPSFLPPLPAQVILKQLCEKTGASIFFPSQGVGILDFGGGNFVAIVDSETTTVVGNIPCRLLKSSIPNLLKVDRTNFLQLRLQKIIIDNKKVSL